jgi:glucose/arabinose dehydrogenase
MAGQGVFSAGSGNAQGTAWNPTILYLFVLVIAEMFIFGFIARKL